MTQGENMGVEGLDETTEAPVPAPDGDDQEAGGGSEAEPVTEEEVSDVPADVPEDDEE